MLRFFLLMEQKCLSKTKKYTGKYHNELKEESLKIPLNLAFCMALQTHPVKKNIYRAAKAYLSLNRTKIQVEIYILTQLRKFRETE